MKTVYIDAGHGENINGGYDPGAVGPRGIRENDVAVDLSRRVGHLLREQGIATAGAALNATADRENLKEAVACANGMEVDFFLSLHCNASVDSRAGGFEVLYRTPVGEQAAGSILREFTTQILLGKSKWLRQPLSLRTRGRVRRTDLYVLNETHMTAVLVEAAFISNPQEERLLINAAAKQAIAQVIADGVFSHLLLR